jgi:hypothetical protein
MINMSGRSSSDPIKNSLPYGQKREEFYCKILSFFGREQGSFKIKKVKFLWAY